MAVNYPSFVFTEPFCSSGEKTLPPVTQTATGNGRTSLRTGFPPETQKPISAGGLPPERVDFNGILNALSQWSAWAGVGGLARWSNTVDYQVGAIVIHNGRPFLCIKANRNTPPPLHK